MPRPPPSNETPPSPPQPSKLEQSENPTSFWVQLRGVDFIFFRELFHNKSRSRYLTPNPLKTSDILMDEKPSHKQGGLVPKTRPPCKMNTLRQVNLRFPGNREFGISSFQEDRI